MSGKQLENVALRPGESIMVNVHGVGYLDIEISAGGRCFIKGPPLKSSRTILEFSEMAGFREVSEREYAAAMD